MHTVTLGRTGIRAGKNGFGALPIQRIPAREAAAILRKAYHHGVNYFDTARWYTDSEEKIGLALGDVRGQIFIATKTGASNARDLQRDLETSLSLLQTDYLDVYQFHNPSVCPKPGDGSGLYEAMLSAKRQGKIRHIGLTNHRPDVAREAVASGLYDTLQFPFSYLSDDAEKSLADLCEENNVGFIAMKALSGGLITNARAAYAFMAQYDRVLPIWGIQKEAELDAFLACAADPPGFSASVRAEIENDRRALVGAFCRGCGYCMPCPAGIQIHTCARMSLLIRRSPSALHLTEASQRMMRQIEGCLHCGQCRRACPYGLDTPALLAEHYQDYQEILRGKPL